MLGALALSPTAAVSTVLGALCVASPSSAHAQASPSSFTTGYRYDVAGRQTGVLAPDPDAAGSLGYAASRNTYDGFGRLSKVETGELSAWAGADVAPATWTGFTIFRTIDYTFDERGRKISEKVSASGAAWTLTQYSYDSFGRLECTAVRMNPSAFASLPASACELGASVSDVQDRITRTVYDNRDQVTTVQRAVGTLQQQDYATYTYFPTASLVDTFANYGKPATVRDANGNVSAMEYGGSVFNHITKLTFPSPTTAGQTNPADFESYTYDANGNRT
ncbi:MAG: hypothetical protein ABL982_23990, partial [Vicinamibacterales bacterium]